MAKRKNLRNTLLWGSVLQLMFIVAAARLQMPLEMFYIVLVLLVGVNSLFYERDNPGELVIDTSHYSIVDIPPQASAGLLLAMPLVAPLVILGGRAIGANILSDFITQAIFVGFAETAYMIVHVRTTWWGEFNLGVWTWPLLFAFMHPIVRDNWIQGFFPIESFYGFFYTAMFGILFYFLWEGRELFKRPYDRYFGAVTTCVTHVVVNLFIILFPLTLLGLEFFPL